MNVDMLDLDEMLPLGLLDDDASTDGDELDLSPPTSPSEKASSAGHALPDVVPSVGSVGHDTGTCRPCAWEPKPGGCSKGQSCEFCHLCEEGEVKKRKKQRLVALKASRLSKKKKEYSSRGKIIPPGPISKTLASTPPGLAVREKAFEQNVPREDSEKELRAARDSQAWAQPQTSKDKDSEDDTASTATSSEKEAPSTPAYCDQSSFNLESFGMEINADAFKFPHVDQSSWDVGGYKPVMLCRDPSGSLYMAPAYEDSDARIMLDW